LSYDLLATAKSGNAKDAKEKTEDAKEDEIAAASEPGRCIRRRTACAPSSLAGRARLIMPSVFFASFLLSFASFAFPP